DAVPRSIEEAPRARERRGRRRSRARNAAPRNRSQLQAMDRELGVFARRALDRIRARVDRRHELVSFVRRASHQDDAQTTRPMTGRKRSLPCGIDFRPRMASAALFRVMIFDGKIITEFGAEKVALLEAVVDLALLRRGGRGRVELWLRDLRS